MNESPLNVNGKIFSWQEKVLQKIIFFKIYFILISYFIFIAIEYYYKFNSIVSILKYLKHYIDI